MRPQIGTYIINTINVGIRGQFMMETKCNVIALKACPYDATTTRALLRHDDAAACALPVIHI